MTDTADLLHSVWDYPLFEAIYGRRSRRFGLGFEANEGPFRHQSQQAPVPLGELEEALLVAAGFGVSGLPLWDANRPPAMGARSGDGRVFGSTSHGRRTALFFTNDSGTYAIGPAAATGAKLRAVQTRDDRASVLELYQSRKQLGAQRLTIPRHSPPLFGHNMWDNNMPGTTLFMPVCDVSAALISLLLMLVDGDHGRYVRGHGGGMNVVDDRHGGRPAGTERWIESGLIDKAKILPLSILERQACYFMFSEPAVICHNMHLATEAIGLGGWMHCGFLSLGIMQALGFRTADPVGAGSFPNPVGFDGVIEGCCPPYFPNMDAAVDAVAARMQRKDGDLPKSSGPTAHKMPLDDYRRGNIETSDEGIACTKAVCNYIYETYGRFPASVDAMHMMWFMQAHHLDLEYYAKYFHAEGLSETHRTHMAKWHGGS